MDVVLCHRTADFDALGAAVGWACLHPGARIVLCSGAHPAVRDFLALYRDEYPLIERRSVAPAKLRTIAIVDTQSRELLGPAAAWLDLPQVTRHLYDHHLQAEGDIAAHHSQIEPVGATTTLMVEQLQAKDVTLSAPEATVMALGIHVDTGSLTYDQSTVRDAAALTWLMGQGANQRAIADYIEPGFSQELQDLLGSALADLQTVTVHGYRLGWVILRTPRYVPGLSRLTSQLMILSESDVLVLGHDYQTRSSSQDRLTIIARSRLDTIDLTDLIKPLGGGGHPQATAVTLKGAKPEATLQRLVGQLQQLLPPPPTAASLMSAPVRTILPEATIDQARRILLRYGHSGLSVVDQAGQLVGIVSRRDLDLALHHGFGHAPVKGYMTAPVRTITPDTPLTEIEALMVTYDIGRLPVVADRQLVGIVTRTDILRQIHHLKPPLAHAAPKVVQTSIQDRLEQVLQPKQRQLLSTAAAAATARGWQLYLVGGAVRDLILAGNQNALTFHEFDVVVDGIEFPQEQGAGVELAQALQPHFPEAQLQVYGQFQTASLIWQEDAALADFAMDIATARSEFYPYPAANPEVSASSIRQDLYRRDFTVNALAVRLTAAPNAAASTPNRPTSELLDFFGGLEDLQLRRIRVLHPNSFVEDPTRIFRAIRFATRLNFTLDPQTEAYIHHAIASGIYQQIQNHTVKAPALQSRLRNELKYILRLSNWPDAVNLMANLGALQCIHPDLHLTPPWWSRVKLACQWLDHFQLGSKSLSQWGLILELLLLLLPHSERITAATQLHLSEPTLARLQGFDTAHSQIASALQQPSPPSAVVQNLAIYEVPLLIEIAPYLAVPSRRQLWQYLQDWRWVTPPLSGDDLIALGYSPGPAFKMLLTTLLKATLDGKIHTRQDAIAYLQSHGPVPKP